MISLLLTGLLLLTQPAFGADADSGGQPQPPDEVVRQTAQDILQGIARHRQEFQSNPQALYEFVDMELLPHFDRNYAGALVLGRHLREVSREQRMRFTVALYQSLIRTYADNLIGYSSDRITVLPFRGSKEDKNATVRTQVRLDDGTEVPVNYKLHLTDKGWQVFDVEIEGVSYIRNYRQQYDSEIAEKGIEAVIERLESQQGGGGQGG